MFNWKKIFKKRIDPKDIPVLDDIIDDDDEFVNKDALIEDYPHLFSNEDEKEEEASSENNEFVIDLNDEIDDDIDDEINSNNNNVVTLSSVINKTDTPESDVAKVDDVEIDNIETDDTKSGSIENETEENNNDIADTEDENIAIDDNIDSTETDDSDVKDAKTTNTNFDLTDPAQLNLIVNKVVEQLMPELEQQLHSLVEKTLAEKSPEELANLLNTDDNHSSDKN
jgi:hypothetical protein